MQSLSRRMLNTREAASYCRLGRSTLEKLRCAGGGPAYLKLGAKRVVYDPADLDKWLAAHKRSNTSGSC